MKLLKNTIVNYLKIVKQLDYFGNYLKIMDSKMSFFKQNPLTFIQ